MGNTINLTIIKRSGQHVKFDGVKICLAIRKAFSDISDDFLASEVNDVYSKVLERIASDFCERKTINVEDIQDIIEKQLTESGYIEISENFHDYRVRRAASRRMSEIKKEHKFLKIQQKLALAIAGANERTPIESIMEYGRIVAREQAKAYLVDRKYTRAHDAGEIYIHHLGCLGLGAISEVTVDALNMQSKMELTQISNFLKGLGAEVSGRIKISNLDKAIENYRLEEMQRRLFTEVESRLTDLGILDLINPSELKSKISKIELSQSDFSDFGAEMVCKIVKNSYIMVEREAVKRVNVEVNKLKRELIEREKRFELAEANAAPLIVARTSVNLPRVAYEAKDAEDFWSRLDEMLDFVKNELVAVYDYLGNRPKSSYQYLFTETVLPDSANLADGQRIRKVLRTGALEINLVGLRQSVSFLGKGNDFRVELLEKISKKAEQMSVTERIRFIISEGTGFNLETEQAAEYFLQIDQSIFGDMVCFPSYLNLTLAGQNNISGVKR